MNANVTAIFESVSDREFRSVASRAIGDPEATPTGRPNWEDIDAVHNDQRTVAIVRCGGQAKTGSNLVDWSVVAKVVDLSMPINVAAEWMSPEIEEMIYELGLLANTGVPFQPAKCFGVSEIGGNKKLLWLEDLGKAPQPPWGLEQYVQVAGHLGRFNGLLATDPPDLPFPLPVDVHRARFRAVQKQVPEQIDSLRKHESLPLVKTAMQDVAVDDVSELDHLWSELIEVSSELPHGVAFGDCHARNLYPLASETVAIDWAGLASEPIGADLSVLVGSALSWGINEGIMVAQHEDEIFEAYVRGLRAGGWNGQASDVRLAFFTHLPLYLILSATLPASIATGKAEARRDWIEARRSSTFEEIPEQIAPILALTPRYVTELRNLLS